MLYSRKQERSRRFFLAMRMGLPILMLIGAVLYDIFSQNHYEVTTFDIILFLFILLASIYFIFFLINLDQTESHVDGMTCAFNRTSLLKELKKAIRKNPDFTIFLIRIDNLPAINDYYGIERADKLLRRFVEFLDEHLRAYGVKDPIIGRYHGGDFIVGVSLPLQTCEKILDLFIQKYGEIDKITVEPRYVAAQMDESGNLEALITYLYDTLSQQKEGEKKSGLQNEKRLDIDKLEEEIVEAVRQGDLILHYVPTLNLKSGEIDLFEVGVKLKTAHNGVLPPKKFIPVVNRRGIESLFDEALFEAICQDAVRIDPKIGFTFNISPFSLRNSDFVEQIVTMLHRYDIKGERFIVELFENRAVKDTSKYLEILRALRKTGIRFALDNFGAPNASFEYIKKLPVDMVQFDKDFTTQYDNPRIAALLRGYIQAFRSSGIKTLVKWIDTEEALIRYRQLGVDYAQGFEIANRPLDSDQLIKRYGESDAIR